jgi:hypothetical protein
MESSTPGCQKMLRVEDSGSPRYPKPEIASVVERFRDLRLGMERGSFVVAAGSVALVGPFCLTRTVLGSFVVRAMVGGIDSDPV